MKDVHSAMIDACDVQSASELNAPKNLQCDICGAKGGRRGGAFRNARHLQVHKAHAHRGLIGSQKSNRTRSELVRSNGNGNGSADHHMPQEHAKFCPKCGCNIAVVNAALSFCGGN